MGMRLHSVCLSSYDLFSGDREVALGLGVVSRLRVTVAFSSFRFGTSCSQVERNEKPGGASGNAPAGGDE